MFVKDTASMRQMGDFATRIAQNKRYMKLKDTGRYEDWDEVAERIAHNIVRPYMPEMVAPVKEAIASRKFLPGGRYIYASGLPYQQVCNCVLMRAEDSKEGWGTVVRDGIRCLMTGFGDGSTYSEIRPEGFEIKGMGGQCTGPISLMNIKNESGRHIMQGGSRRSALWAGLGWWHPDILKFICCKDWSELHRYCKSKDFNFPAPMDGTNISVMLDDDFFAAIKDPNWTKTYSKWGTTFTRTHKDAVELYQMCVYKMLTTGEPGFSIDIGDNSERTLRNAPVHGSTKVLTEEGYKEIEQLADIPVTVWTGKQWAKDVVFKKTGEMVETVKVAMTGGRQITCDPTHPFLVESYTGGGKHRRLVGVERVAAADLEEGDIISLSLPTPPKQKLNKGMYTLGYLYGDGSFTSCNRAEVTICTEGKKACLQNFSKSLDQTIKEKDSRGYTRIYFNTNKFFSNRHKAVCPEDVQGDEATASFLAGLFDADGNVEMRQKRVRLSSIHKDFLQSVNRMLESLGILAHISKGGPSGYGGNVCWQLVVASDYNQRFMEMIPTVRVRYDFSDYKAYRKSYVKVVAVEESTPADVYCADVKVEEHCFQAEGVLISNCTEVDSDTNLDMCNLASINLSRIKNKDEFRHVMRCSVALQICGTLVGDLPLPEMYKVRQKNRRIGLGLMGIHAWLIQRGYNYDINEELGEWLDVYKTSGDIANEYADRLNISRPVATRSIAPNGTISIIGETTGGIEPIFAVAYKRRFLEKRTWKAQYIVDPTAKMLIEDYKVNPNTIEDSFTLADDPERRLRFQAWVQSYVDHAISSTLNLPEWGSSTNNEGTVKRFEKAFLENLPKLRGMTTYPNGARDGQPLVRTPYLEAVKRGIGVEFNDGKNVEDEEAETYLDIAEGIIHNDHHPKPMTDKERREKELELPLGAMCKNGVCGE